MKVSDIFKEGDKVKALEGYTRMYYKGDIGVVDHVYHNGMLSIAWETCDGEKLRDGKPLFVGNIHPDKVIHVSQ